MNGLLKFFALTSIAAASMAACGACTSGSRQTAAAESPSAKAETPAAVFDADSAYAFVGAQTAFGPRVPGSPASRECAQWLMSTLRRLGATNVTEQHTQLRAYDGTLLDACNISARINPDARKRILLLSHWDSRPWADQEEDPGLRDTPIDGANDGASGVGVILEIARVLQQHNPKVGVDILFVDAEDYGRRADQPTADANESSWCLGTQYWVQNPSLALEDIRYAILLDMVGGKDAVFPKEYFSETYASDINDKVWRAAAQAGYADRFPQRVGTPVIDDHIYLLRNGIPAIDIIETDHPSGTGFNPTWHTLDDNIENIDPATLKAVGQTVLNLILNE